MEFGALECPSLGFLEIFLYLETGFSEVDYHSGKRGPHFACWSFAVRKWLFGKGRGEPGGGLDCGLGSLVTYVAVEGRGVPLSSPVGFSRTGSTASFPHSVLWRQRTRQVLTLSSAWESLWAAKEVWAGLAAITKCGKPSKCPSQGDGQGIVAAADDEVGAAAQAEELRPVDSSCRIPRWAAKLKPKQVTEQHAENTV